MTYEDLLIEADSAGLITKEKPLKANNGRIKGNKIAIKNTMSEIQKACVLAEELGHYYTTTGNILDQTITVNRKQERAARFLSYNKMVGLYGIVCAYKHNCTNLHETADYLGVTEEFLQEALECYRQKYGVSTTLDNYIIVFEPNLMIFQRFE